MSKIANRVITFPHTITINIDRGENHDLLWVVGPRGISKKIKISHEVKIIEEDNKITTYSAENIPLAGTYNSLLTSLIKGVNEGLQQILEIRGVGYKAEIKKDELVLTLGKSHLDYIKIPDDLNIEIGTGQKSLIIKGVDKERIRSFAAFVRTFRKPGAYHNKGIYFIEEKVKLKQSKTVTK